MLTDMSPFGVTTYGRDSQEMLTSGLARPSQKHLVSSFHQGHHLAAASSLDTETLQVMFADSMTTAHLNNYLAGMGSSGKFEMSDK